MVMDSDMSGSFHSYIQGEKSALSKQLVHQWANLIPKILPIQEAKQEHPHFGG